MNRQIRRAQEKSDKKRDRDTEKKREAKRNARLRRRGQSEKAADAKPAAKTGTEGQAAPGARVPSARTGRFAGILALATTVLIFIGAFDQRETLETVNYLVDAAFFLFLGYFGHLWLLRRGTANAFAITLVGGIAVAVGVQLVRVVGADLAAQPVMVLLAVPGLVIGSWIALGIYRRTA